MACLSKGSTFIIQVILYDFIYNININTVMMNYDVESVYNHSITDSRNRPGRDVGRMVVSVANKRNASPSLAPKNFWQTVPDRSVRNKRRKDHLDLSLLLIQSTLRKREFLDQWIVLVRYSFHFFEERKEHPKSP